MQHNRGSVSIIQYENLSDQDFNGLMYEQFINQTEFVFEMTQSGQNFMNISAIYSANFTIFVPHQSDQQQLQQRDKDYQTFHMVKFTVNSTFLPDYCKTYLITKDTKMKLSIAFNTSANTAQNYQTQFFANSKYFIKNDFQQSRFQSDEYIYLYDYQILINPILSKKEDNKFSIFSNPTKAMHFQFNPPYNRYQIDENQVKDDLIYKYQEFTFQFQSYEQPQMTITIIPDNFYNGLAKIGGYITFIGIARIGLQYFNEGFYKRSLYKKFQNRLNDHLGRLEHQNLKIKKQKKIQKQLKKLRKSQKQNQLDFRNDISLDQEEFDKGKRKIQTQTNNNQWNNNQFGDIVNQQLLISKSHQNNLFSKKNKKPEAITLTKAPPEFEDKQSRTQSSQDLDIQSNLETEKKQVNYQPSQIYRIPSRKQRELFKEKINYEAFIEMIINAILRKDGEIIDVNGYLRQNYSLMDQRKFQQNQSDSCSSSEDSSSGHSDYQNKTSALEDLKDTTSTIEQIQNEEDLQEQYFQPDQDQDKIIEKQKIFEEFKYQFVQEVEEQQLAQQEIPQQNQPKKVIQFQQNLDFHQYSHVGGISDIIALSDKKKLNKAQVRYQDYDANQEGQRQLNLINDTQTYTESRTESRIFQKPSGGGTPNRRYDQDQNT
eukprot:403359407